MMLTRTVATMDPPPQLRRQRERGKRFETVYVEITPELKRELVIFLAQNSATQMAFMEGLIRLALTDHDVARRAIDIMRAAQSDEGSAGGEDAT